MQIANADFVRTRTGLLLNVTAIAPTLNWKNVQLSLAVYIVPPEDGLQDVILSATPPTGPAPTAIEVFECSILVPEEEWFEGVRITNAANESLLVLRNPNLKAAPVGTDPFFMSGVGIRKDKLLIDVSYGGGCRRHAFQLNWDGTILKSEPPKLILELSHNSNGDNCRALLHEQLQFDLTTLPGFPVNRMELLIQSSSNAYKITYEPQAVLQTARESTHNLAGGVVGNG